MHYEISSNDAYENDAAGTPTAHADVLRIVGFLVEQRAVNIVGPDSGKGADVARHSGHKTSHQRGDTQSQQSRAAVSRQHQGEHFIVAVPTGSYRGALSGEFHRQNRNSEQAGEND